MMMTMTTTVLLIEHEGCTGEYCPKVVADYGLSAASFAQKWPRDNIPQYG